MITKVPLKVQKMIMWIPGLNAFNLLIWLYNSRFLDHPTKIVPKTLWILLSTLAPLGVLQQIIINVFPGAVSIMTFLFAYSAPLVIGYRLIILQESLQEG